MRTEMRQQLYAGCTRVKDGRPGVDIPTSRLLEMWPKYLDIERAAAKPTLTLTDVAAMLEEKETPRFNALLPRKLCEEELDAIRIWFRKADAEERGLLGEQLSKIQGSIMAQAAANHGAAMDILQRLDGKRKSSTEMLKEARTRKQEEARDKLFGTMRYVGWDARAAAINEESPLRSVAEYAQELRKPELLAALAKKKSSEQAEAQIRVNLKRKSQQDLSELCHAFGVETTGTKQQQMDRVFVARHENAHKIAPDELRRIDEQIFKGAADKQEGSSTSETAFTEASAAEMETFRLVAWIHACAIPLVEKLHGSSAMPSLVGMEGLEEFQSHPMWESHQRLEVNTRLDAVSRDLTYTARDDGRVTILQKIWLTRLLLNKCDARASVEKKYKAATEGRSLYEGELCKETLREALLGIGPLDNACAGMRRSLWHTVHQKLGKEGAHKQQEVCVELWDKLRRDDAFEDALQKLTQGVPLSEVLRDTLWVHNKFLAMLIARDCAVLLPALVTVRDVEACTAVGGGAETVLVKCTEGTAAGRTDAKGRWQFTAQCKATFESRLLALHETVREHLNKDLVSLVVPQGWTLDLTENACCELRRWTDARGHRKRDSNADRKAQRQNRRVQEVSATWKLLGFEEPPALCASKASSS